MFTKMTSFTLKFDDIEVLDNIMIKTASVKLPEGYKYDPEYMYLRVRAVSAGEYWGANKNFDYFPEEELKKYYKTFLSAHTFKNHDNKDVAKAIGDVISAEWDDNMKGVYLVITIDRKIAPTIVRGFEKGYMTDVSMGCKVSHSVCSICGNKARTSKEYCDHIKKLRGKVLDDGRKVFEINIGPKFHDISAVLTGAERVAKAVGIIINGNKVAFETTSDEIEKVAKSNFAAEFEKAASIASTSIQSDVGSDATKQSTPSNMDIKFNSFVDDNDAFRTHEKRTFNKVAYHQKVAEIKKELQGRVVRSATGKFINESLNNSKELINTIKLFHTNYWDKSKCEKIAEYIKNIADRKGIEYEVAFDQFLKVLDFACIELSPLEFHDIMYSLLGVKTMDLRELPVPSVEIKPNDIDNISESIGNSLGAEGSEISVPSMLAAINSIFHKENIRESLSNLPIGKAKVSIIKSIPNVEVNEDIAFSDMMHDIVKHFLPSRSGHRRFIIKRITNTGNISISPSQANIGHFTPFLTHSDNDQKIKDLPLFMSKLAYSAYQNEREKNFNGETLEYGLTKFASFFEEPNMENAFSEIGMSKTAGFKGTVRKATLAGVPATYAYSAYQRARVNNGKRISDFNRYIAENPGNVATMNLLLTPVVMKTGRKVIKNSGKGIKESITKNVKKADDFLMKKYSAEEQNIFEKSAEYGRMLYNKDMFKDEDIDNAMLSSNYTQNHLNAVKMACYFHGVAREDLADEILVKNSLDESDLFEYLKIAENCIKMELEKTAGALRDIGEYMVNGSLYNNKNKASMLSLAPGLALDGFVLSKALGSKPKKTNQKFNKMEGVVE